MESRFRRNCPCLNHPPFAATGGIALDAMRPCISASSSIATWSTPFGCEGSGYSKLWKSKRFNEMCVLGGGEFLEVGAMLRPVGVYHVCVFSN